jgi:hypothetical protein
MSGWFKVPTPVWLGAKVVGPDLAGPQTLTVAVIRERVATARECTADEITMLLYGLGCNPSAADDGAMDRVGLMPGEEVGPRHLGPGPGTSRQTVIAGIPV